MKNIGELKVQDYMSHQTIVVDDTARLTDAISIMTQNRISVIPVVDNQGQLVGILSNSDLIQMTHEIQSDLNALHHVNEKTQDFLIRMLMDQGDNTKVQDIMTSPVETICPQTNLVVAARKLTEKKYHHLPVVTESGENVGILATTDLVRAIADTGALAAG